VPRGALATAPAFVLIRQFGGVTLLARAVADRVALLTKLRSAGAGLLAGLILTTLAGGLVPAAVALAFAALSVGSRATTA
jgi:hypothetical protein